MKKVVIVGHQGQDGRHLWELCKKNDYSIAGIGNNKTDCYKLTYPDIVDITDKEQVSCFISTIRPDYLFYFAAYHHSSEEKILELNSLYRHSYLINCVAYFNFLESIAEHSPESKIFYASSAHIFEGGNHKAPINESNQYSPQTIYSITKVHAMEVGRYFKNNRSLFIANGILFGHESVYRKNVFASKKIVSTAVSIYHGKSKQLVMGDLNTFVDWGYAGDFAEAYLQILQCSKPDDYVIAMGQFRQIKEFVYLVFTELGLDYDKYVVENTNIIKRATAPMRGDYTKLNKMTGWKPKLTLEGLAKRMVQDELLMQDINLE